MTLSVGPDMSPEKTSIRVIRAHGKIMKGTQVAGGLWRCQAGSALRTAQSPPAGLEAGPLPQRLHRGLSEAELPVVLMETPAGERRPEGHVDQDGPS